MIQDDINRFLSSNVSDYLSISKIKDTIDKISTEETKEQISNREYIRRLLILIAKNDKDFRNILNNNKEYMDKIYGTHKLSKYFYNKEINNIIID